MLEITGDTYDIRDRLKALGCRWDDAERVWSAPDESVRAEGQALADAEPWRKWREFMETLAWAPGEFTTTAWEAGLNACSRGIPMEAALQEIGQRITAAGGDAKPAWLKRNVGRAYEKAEPPRQKDNQTIGQSDNRGRRYEMADDAPKPLPKPEFEEGKLKGFAGPWAKTVDALWLADRSPVPPQETTPDGFLRALYAPGERVVIFDVFESQGQWLWSAEKGFEPSVVNHRVWDELDRQHVTPPPTREGKAFAATGPSGIWYLCNPVDGSWQKTAETDKWGRPKWSRRSEPEIARWRYFAIESDEADARDWMGAIVQLPLPIAAIYTSGGRSVHVLVRVDASSKAEFDQWRETAKRVMIPLGADKGCMSAVRLTRLPGCLREQDGKGVAYRAPRLQRLLFLDPAPRAVPLCERTAVRDTFGPWETWAAGVLTVPRDAVPAEEMASVDVGIAAIKGMRGGERALRVLRELERWKG